MRDSTRNALRDQLRMDNGSLVALTHASFAVLPINNQRGELMWMRSHQMKLSRRNLSQPIKLTMISMVVENESLGLQFASSIPSHDD